MQIKNKHTHRHTRAYTWGACKKGVKTVLPKKLCTTKQKRAARKAVRTKTFSSNCIPSNVPQGWRVHSRIVVVCNWFDAFCSFFCVCASICLLHFLEFLFCFGFQSSQVSWQWFLILKRCGDVHAALLIVAGLHKSLGILPFSTPFYDQARVPRHAVFGSLAIAQTLPPTAPYAAAAQWSAFANRKLRLIADLEFNRNATIVTNAA